MISCSVLTAALVDVFCHLVDRMEREHLAIQSKGFVSQNFEMFFALSVSGLRQHGADVWNLGPVPGGHRS